MTTADYLQAFAVVVSLLFATTVDAGSWGRWLRSDCYSSLEYRVRYLRAAGGDRHEWAVDVHNRYRQQASFYWVLVKGDQATPRLNNQMNLRPGGRLRRNSMTTADPRDGVRFVAGRLRLGGKESVEQPCDAGN